MNSTRTIAVSAGVFFIVAAVAAILGLGLTDPVLNQPDYIVTAGDDTLVVLGAFFEVIHAIAVIGTAVALFPIVKRQNEGIALGYVAGRLLEAVVIVVGIMSLASTSSAWRTLCSGRRSCPEPSASCWRSTAWPT